MLRQGGPCAMWCPYASVNMLVSNKHHAAEFIIYLVVNGKRGQYRLTLIGGHN